MLAFLLSWRFLGFVVVQIAQGQKVAKLDEKQTADMIKITCQRPDVRQGAIHQQFNNINGTRAYVLLPPGVLWFTQAEIKP